MSPFCTNRPKAGNYEKNREISRNWRKIRTFREIGPKSEILRNPPETPALDTEHIKIAQNRKNTVFLRRKPAKIPAFTTFYRDFFL